IRGDEPATAEKGGSTATAGEGWIEGRLLTLKGEPVSRDPRSKDRLSVAARTLPEQGGAAGAAEKPVANGESTASIEIDDEGRVRLRVAPGRVVLRVSSPEIHGRLWRRAQMGRGTEVRPGETATVMLRVLDKSPSPPRPPRADNGQVKMPEPVP